MSRNHLDTLAANAGADASSGSSQRLTRVLKKTLGRLLIAFAVVALPLLGLGAKHGVESIRRWWGRSRAENAIESNDHADLRQRAEAIMNAMRATPNDPGLLRTWASFLKQNKGSPSDRVAALKQVVSSPDATDEDRKELTLALIDNSQFDDVKPVLDSLPESQRQSTELREARAALLDAGGDHAAALKLRREAWEAALHDPRNRLNLALLDLNEPFEEKRNAAIETLWVLSQGADENALRAIHALSRLSSLTPSRAEQLLHRIESLPSASKRDVFAVLGAVLRTHPGKRESIIADEVKKARGYGAEDLTAFLPLLDEARAWTSMLSLIPEEKAYRDRDLCVMRIKALSELKCFSELESMLTSRQMLPLTPGHLAVLRAFLHQKKGDTGEAMRQLGSAISRAIADEDTDAVRRIAGFAREQGFGDIAATAFQWLADHDKTYRMAALNDLFNTATTNRDASLMLSTAERISNVRQGNTPALRDLAYLRLLLGSRMETVPAIIDRLDETNATAAATTADIWLLRAFLAYRLRDQGMTADALHQISDWSALSAGRRAVAAALHRFVGSEQSAFDLASRLPTLAILPEEKNLWLSVASSQLTRPSP